MTPLRIILITLALIVAVAAGFIVYELAVRVESRPEQPGVGLKIRVPGVGEEPVLMREENGSLRYLIVNDRTGATDSYSPDEFARLVYDANATHHWWERVLNITTPWGAAWVAFGLIGQLAFSGRMIIQWIVSEREKRSIVPASFWWMSIIGASMLLAYFIWRRDVVGVLGQGIGWAIYARNLWLIYKRHESQPVSEDAAAEPSLAEN